MEHRKQSKQSDKTLVAGRKPVMELLAEKPGSVDMVNIKKGRLDSPVRKIIGACKELGIRYKFVDQLSLDRLHPGQHQGVVAQVAAVEYADLDELMASVAGAPLPLLLVLDRVQDTGNVGALARSLYALGGAGIVVPQHETAYLGSGAVKSSAGAVRKLPIARATNLSRALEDMERAGLFIYAAHKDEDAANVFDPKLKLATPAALVLGNEEKGIRPGLLKHCPNKLTIPFARAFDSLNVSQAGAMLMAAFARACR